jgi:hypothetical protein
MDNKGQLVADWKCVGNFSKSGNVMTHGNRLLSDSIAPDLRRQVEALKWFHQIDLGNGLISPGTIERSKIEQCSNIVFSRVNVSGKSVLDIGCWDGAYRIEAMQRGASRVLATRSLGLAQRLRPHVLRPRTRPSCTVDRGDGRRRCRSFGRTPWQVRRGPFHGRVLSPAASVPNVGTCCEISARMPRCGISAAAAAHAQTDDAVISERLELDGDPTNWWGSEPALCRGHATGFGVSSDYVHALEILAARNIPRVPMTRLPQ